jgi:hypothetical protein
MKKIILLGGWMLLFGLFTRTTHAQLNVVRIQETKIFDNRLFDVLTYLKTNQSYCDHWTKDWVYPIQKSKLMHGLREQYSVMMGYDNDELELQLLMGLTAHFLYNLDDTAYFEVAITHFKKALSLNTGDGRAMWAMAKHQALSGRIIDGWQWMEKASLALSMEDQKDFWNDYAMIAAMANMPAHSIKGMEEYKKMNHRPSYFESKMGNAIRARIVPVNKDSIYAKEQIWFLHRSGANDEYTCNPEGIRFMVDSTCKVIVHDYQQKQNALILQPASFFNQEGRAVNMSMLILIHPASDEESLKANMKSLTGRWKNIAEKTWDSEYGKLIAFEIKEPELYAEMGGGHLWMVGFERMEPPISGLPFEQPSQPESQSEGLNLFHPTETIGRFKGKIQYVFLLDTCEAIYEPSLAFFKKFIDQQLIVE